MSFLDLFKSENEIVVQIGKSKGPTPLPVQITVGDIKKGVVYDATGYKNEIVLFLRKNKADR